MASNALAALMSVFIPGLGQIYKGHFLRGVFFLLTWWLVIPYFWGIIDAYILPSSGPVTVVQQQQQQVTVINQIVPTEQPKQE